MKLSLKNAEKARNKIINGTKREISKLYQEWAKEIGKEAEKYKNASTHDDKIKYNQLKILEKQLKNQSKTVLNEVQNLIKQSIYLSSQTIISENIEWLKELGFNSEILNAAFSFVPDNIVRKLITGQIYEQGWSLSKALWGDNEKTMQDIYTLVAKGIAENKSVYDIAKDLEIYVNPTKKKPWNPVIKMKNTKTGEYEYKRIYKEKVDYVSQRLARTLSQHAYQQSLVETTEKNPFVQEFVWISNGSRPCEICEKRNGKHYKKNELPLDHPNGMCTFDVVIDKNINSKLKNWLRSPDGTYPEIDKFANTLWDEAKKGKLTLTEKLKKESLLQK